MNLTNVDEPAVLHDRPADAAPPAAAAAAPHAPLEKKRPLLHLRATFVAVLIAVNVLAGGVVYAERQEARYLDQLAPRAFMQKNFGSALQRQALRQSDLLPVYGACELNQTSGFHPNTVLRGYPTGFTVFTVPRVGPHICLSILQSIAALGNEVRGKKIVIVVGHSTFVPMKGTVMDEWYTNRAMRQMFYDMSYAPLAAGSLLFETDVSYDVRRAAAARMAEYRESPQHDPLVRFAIDRLVGNSWIDRLEYAAVLPVGRLQNAVRQLQDHFEVLAYMRERVPMHVDLPRTPGPLDWARFAPFATDASRRASASNPYGIHNEWWEMFGPQAPLDGSASEEEYLRRLSESTEMQDLALLLQTLQELGADTLLVASPIKGPIYDRMGIRRQTRQQYYDKIRDMAARYGARCVNFPEHDENPLFLADEMGRPSHEGWMHIDRALVDFYHDTRK